MMSIKHAREILLKLFINQIGMAGDDVMIFLLGEDLDDWESARDALNTLAHFAEAENINRMIPEDLKE